MFTKQNFFSVIIVVALIWGVSKFFEKDVYIGFFYPDANDLTVDIQSPAFNSLDACRDWVNDQAATRHLSGTDYDYECGKNCDLQNGQKPYVCEETLE